MPSQLYNNSAVEFICARNFLFDGVEYALGQEFPQEAAGKQLEVLVRTRRVIPVVDSRDDKPRHWFREIRVKSEVLDKLQTAQGEHLLNTPTQLGTTPGELDVEEFSPWEETRDNAEAIHEARSNRIEEGDDVARPGKQDIKLVNGKEETEPVNMLGEAYADADVEYKEIDETPTAESKFQKDLYDGKVEASDVEVAPPTHEDPSNSDYDKKFDPNKATVEEVNEYLKTADETERERVLAAEAEGKDRKGVTRDE